MSARSPLARLRDTGLRRLGVEPYLHRRLNVALAQQQDLRRQVQELQQQLAQQRAAAERAARSEERRLSRLESRLTRLAAQHEKLDARSERVTRLTTALDQTYTRRLPLMNRVISRAAMDELLAQISAVTGVEQPAPTVAAAYTTVLELESRGLGRVAGTVANVLGKLSVVPLLDPPGDEVLEIGTLFGLFAAGLERQLFRIGRCPQLTIVDPMDGQQLQGGRAAWTDVTGVPAVPAVVRRNLELAGLGPDRVRLLIGLSGDETIRDQVRERRYGVVIVDGDHSGPGVRADLELAEQVTAPGGIVVVDDYGDAKWPQVQQAADTHLAGSSRLRLLGTVATSAFLRAEERGPGGA